SFNYFATIILYVILVYLSLLAGVIHPYSSIFFNMSSMFISASSMFVEKGQNVHLDVPGYEKHKEKIGPFILFTWNFNGVESVVAYNKQGHQAFIPYVRFSEVNLSLLLENVQERDSGSYTAILGFILSGYMLVCLLTLSSYLFSERVEPPVLTVDSVSSILDTCNVTVTCRGQNTTVTSICNNHTCSQVGGGSSGSETSTVSLLSVYVAGGTIICNHSNQVSWANDNKEIVELCPMKSVDLHFNLMSTAVFFVCKTFSHLSLLSHTMSLLSKFLQKSKLS
uniref:Immunoglobulin subtype domain-containing protein n=1 Tax=Esox lucius TaxID=8010 RepID=A0AAY5KAV3_ESOLU